MNEGKLNDSDLLDIKSRLSQYLRLLDEVEIHSGESAKFWGEELQRIVSLMGRTDLYDHRLEEFTEKINSEFNTKYSSVLESRKKVLDNAVEKIAAYNGIECDLAWKLIKEANEVIKIPTKIYSVIQPILDWPIDEQLYHSYHMMLIEGIVEYFLSVSDFWNQALTEVSLNREETKTARENLRQAKHYLDEAFKILPPSYLHLGSPSLKGTMKALDRILDVLEVPAHRHENQFLNILLSALVNFLIDIGGYSKKRSFQLTGEVLVKHGLLEDGDYLPDKVRHRYERHKDAPIPNWN